MSNKTSPTNKPEVTQKRNSAGLRNLLAHIGIPILKASARSLYFFQKLIFPAQNKVVLISRRNHKTSLDFQMIRDYLSVQHPDIRTIVLNHKKHGKFSHLWQVLLQMHHLATAKACIVDSYVIPVSILKHRPSLTIIQMWHALGAIKKFGWAALDTAEGSSSYIARAMQMHNNYTFITAGGPATIPHFSEGFGADAKIIKPIGMPRVDLLLSKDVHATTHSNILKKYPQLQNDKPTILYAPTFRKTHSTKPQELVKIIETNSYNLIIKKHFLDTTEYHSAENIIIDEHFEAMELLFVADFLVTDYSAITFEAAVLEIPTIFYTYDLEQYQRNRGLFFDPSMFPGPLCSDADQVFEHIMKKRYDTSGIEKFRDRFIAVDDGTSTQKIVELLDL